MANRAALLLLSGTVPINSGSSLLGQHAQLLGGTGLADARLTGQHDQPSLAAQGVIQG